MKKTFTVKFSKPIKFNPYQNNQLKTTKSLILKNKSFLSTSGDKGVSLKGLNLQIFHFLDSYLITNPINEETQLAIEKFLIDQWQLINDKKLNSTSESLLNFNLFSPNIIKILKEDLSILENLLNNFRKNSSNLKGIKLNIEQKISFNLYSYVYNISNEKLISLLFGRLLRILSSNNQTNYDTKCVNVFYELGLDLINLHFHSLFSEEVNKNLSYIEWRNSNNKYNLTLNNSTLLVELGSRLIQFLMDLDYLKISTTIQDNNDKINVLSITEKLSKHIGNNTIFNLPTKLPMIVKPKVWNSKGEDGGYLMNGVSYNEPIIIKKVNTKYETEILNDNIIINLINNINSVGYKINTQVLEFIIKNNHEFEFFISLDTKHPLTNKVKLSKKEKTILESYSSTVSLEQNILNIALVYSKLHEFYIPVRLDYRGRLYAQTLYLNYQSTDLAKSLLLFSKTDRIYKSDINAINYFKVYGANCFGLDKISFNDRIKWVDDNTNLIINYSNGVLLKKAENKCLFLAFCIEFTKYYNSLNDGLTYFDTNFPIQLDATCNGYQHLALLTGDVHLMSELNLDKSDFNQKPKDFYTFLTLKVKEYFESEIKSNKLDSITKNSYKRLLDLEIKRSIIKKAVMTIVYNVSFINMVSYMKESFDLLENEFHHKDNFNIALKKEDFNNLARGLLFVMHRDFPRLNNLMKYLKEIAKITSILNIHIPWLLPTGLKVKQSYLESEEVKIQPFSYLKYTFTIKNFKSNKINLRKQMNAFMPNLIHSLDAASLALLVDFFYKDPSIKINNFYSIHDCFGVTANNVVPMINLLKSVYIHIYFDIDYLITLDSDIKSYIKKVFGDKIFIEGNQTIILPKIGNYSYPDINEVISNKLNVSNLIKSSYLVN